MPDFPECLSLTVLLPESFPGSFPFGGTSQMMTVRSPANDPACAGQLVTPAYYSQIPSTTQYITAG